jgi:fructokinase
MKKILCIGEALIDMICTDKGSSLADGRQFVKKPGGAPTNVAAAIGALGGQAELAAKVGADPFGHHLVEVLHQFNVGTRWVRRDPDHFTTLAFVSLLENGERDFYFNRGADSRLSFEEVDKIDLNTFSIVHFGSATGFLPGPLQNAYRGLLEKALQLPVFISFDPNYRHLLFRGNTQTFIEQSWYFLNHCHFFKVSDEEALLLTGAASLEEAVIHFSGKTRAVFAITLGKEGTLLRYGNQIITIPSIPVTPVDTTGAGDAFVGAVLYQAGDKTLKEILSLSFVQWQQMIHNANKAGARTCEYMGAMEAFKHLSSGIFQ